MIFQIWSKKDRIDSNIQNFLLHQLNWEILFLDYLEFVKKFGKKKPLQKKEELLKFDGAVLKGCCFAFRTPRCSAVNPTINIMDSG